MNERYRLDLPGLISKVIKVEKESPEVAATRHSQRMWELRWRDWGASSDLHSSAVRFSAKRSLTNTFDRWNKEAEGARATEQLSKEERRGVRPRREIIIFNSQRIALPSI